MKTIKLIALILIIFLTLSTCKKDYPDDIPLWIKKIIKDCKKNSCCYGYGGSLGISELKNIKDGSLIYMFSGVLYPTEISFYDEFENLICKGDYISVPGIDCRETITNNYFFVRKIWGENKDRCR